MTTPDLAGLCKRLRLDMATNPDWAPVARATIIECNTQRYQAAAAIESLVAALTLLDDAIWLNPDTGNFEINHDGSVEKARAIRTALEGASR